MKTLKVIGGGEGNVGKTSLFRPYAQGTFSRARKITFGVDITSPQISVDGEEVRLTIWDIEGQDGNRPNVYIGRQAAALVYDVTESSFLEALDEWCQRLRRYGSETPIVVACDKVDPGLAFPPSWRGVFARAVGARHGFVSDRTGDSVSTLFQLPAESAADDAALAPR